MSIDSGGTNCGTRKIDEELIDKEKIDDDELEDGELDSDDDDEPIKEVTTKKEKTQSSKSNSNSTTTSSIAKQDSNKSTSSSKFQSSKQQQQQSRKRNRRSGSVDSDGDLDNNKRRKPNNRNNTKSNNNRNKRSNASTDDDSDSDDGSSSNKIDSKMMFTMLKKMEEWLMNNNDKSNKHNRQEYDKFFERVKNNKSGHKEMMRFIKKNGKMIGQSSQDNLPAMFNSFNPNLFPPNPMSNNMFGPNGCPPGVMGVGPPMQPQFGPPQMNHPGMMPGPGNQFGGPPFNGPPSFNPTLLPNPMQPQFGGPLNDIGPPHRNSPGGMGGGPSGPSNKKQKKRKKQKDDKEDKDEQDDLIVNKQVCKYFLEGFCQKGDNCDFLHQQPYNYKREVCKFYLQDSCGKGDNCTFLHKEFPCKLHHTGQDCILGENCKFSHEPMNEELREIFVNYLDNAELNEELNVAYGLSKNNAKKAPILGNVPEDVKGSYATWVWQQEMKKLELAYTGTKRNLFCIDDQFVLKEKPPKDSSYVDDYEDEDEDVAEFAKFKDIDERQTNFYFDTHGDLDEDEDDDDDFENNPFTKDNDLRRLSLTTTTTANELQPTLEPEVKSLDEVKKQWLNDESDEELGDHKDDDKKSSIDISKMLDAIRQTTTSTQSNQKLTKDSNSNSTNNNSEFWKSLLNGVNLDENQSTTTQTDQDERLINQAKVNTTPPSNQPRDPRLLRQRNNSIHQQQQQQQQKSSQTTSIQKILADEPYTWSHGDISFKLYKIDVNKIDYSLYQHAYELDSKLKNDPRLQNYFSGNSQQSKLSSLSSSSSSSNSNNNNIINPTDLLAPLTLSQKNEHPTKSLIIPPAPSSKLSALDLISPSSSSKSQTTSSSQLSFEEQILASVHLPKTETGGLTSLADLVKSKKVINSSEDLS